MENKYFVPEISDIRIGYECEVKAINKDLWQLTVLDSKMVLAILLKHWEAKTSFLIKEQIEREGWNKKNNFQFAIEVINDRENFEGFDLKLKENKVIISSYSADIHSGGRLKTLYNGKCASINELRYISKLLNIN